MNLSTQPYKGARDFYPEDKRLQKWMFAKWREVVESYGYEEYDAPVLEPTELYASKTSDEIVNEQTYSFTDRGGRNVTIRTEMTPSVSRMVAGKRQELPYPMRLYSIPNLWRYERPQRGRLREFWQLNVDLFGVNNIYGDFEMLQISNSIMKSFGAKSNMFKIKINSRKLVNYIFEDYFKLNQVQAKSLIQLFDKKNKIENTEFVGKLNALLTPSQKEQNLADDILRLFSAKNIESLPSQLNVCSSVNDLKSVLNLCSNDGITNIEFDISLMRGFDYYTDIVFEVFDNHPENNRSMFGGGRYDGLVGAFGVEPISTVGFGMGDATLYNFLLLHELMLKQKSETDVYVVLIGNVFGNAHKLINLLREMDLNVAVDFSGNKIDKQIKMAIKKGIRYVLFIGEQEIAENQFTLKDLLLSKEEKHSLERVASIIKDYRNNKL
jgi:histidyl-tRNA synthetase